MTKKKILLAIPLLIVLGFLLYSWAVILFTNNLATWRHYIALALAVVLIYVFFKDWTKAVLATGIYLILGTFNLLTFTVSIQWSSFFTKMGSLEISTPTFQPLSFGIFVLYFFLNFDNLVNIYLDYKELKQQNKNESI